ncbi:SufD family Fe-S cluster assembly protein, partial [Candidatus Magnetaquicoccus inordinatus]|uniref:SufD family Fe-S cluster assembly protein n=1 Tax=Candidatus Magnetaquicoccus inordinatus TaxID=2496818 RepID=UPI00187D34E8
QRCRECPRKCLRATAICIIHAEPAHSLLLGASCSAHTYPYIEVKNSSAKVEHEATTSRISEEQMFYCRQRGLSSEQAVALIVNGFSQEVLRELPMEFSVEARKLLEVNLEGCVG